MHLIHYDSINKVEDDQSSKKEQLERRESDVLNEMSTRKEEERTTTTAQEDKVEAELTEIRAQLQALVMGQNQMMEHLAQLTAIARQTASR